MPILKKIELTGDKNITIQSEKDVTINLNLNNVSECLAFFSKYLDK